MPLYFMFLINFNYNYPLLLLFMLFYCLAEMNIQLGSFLEKIGIHAKFAMSTENFQIPEIEFIDLDHSLWKQLKDYIFINKPEDRKDITKGEILGIFDIFDTGLSAKSYILVDYWLENGERKLPIIKDIAIREKDYMDISRKQLAALLTISDYSARVRFMIDDFFILEQYLNLTGDFEVTIHDPDTNNLITGIITESEIVDFKLYYFLKPNFHNYGSDKIRFGVESFVKLSFVKGTLISEQEVISKQQKQMYTKCQNSRENAAGPQHPEKPTRKGVNLEPAYDYSQPKFVRKDSPKPHPQTAPPTVGHSNKNMQFPQNDTKQPGYHKQDKKRNTQGQGAESDAVPLNDLEPKQPNSYGIVENCLVKVHLMKKYHYGRVVWTGVFKQVPDHLWVLIETEDLQNINEEETHGIKYGIKIGNVKPGHGLFVPANRCETIVPGDIQCDKLPRSSLIGSPNEYDPCAATIITGEFVPPIKDLSKILGLKKGIQGLDNSCYMDASLFGMFCFNSRLDDIFLKESQETPSVERYTVVQKILKERIVYPLRKEGFARADQVLLLRHKLDEAGVLDGLIDRERDPEEFLTCLLQHVLNVQPYLKIRGARNEDGFFFQIFTHRRPHINLPTVQTLLEHAFREDKLMLAEVPQFFLIQMPRDGKHFRLYPNIVPSLTLDISSITQSVYSPKCVLCSELAALRCEECERCELYDARKVYIHYCLNCSDLHSSQTKHNPTELTCVPKQQPGCSTKMKLFAVLTIDVAHYVCFAKCGANPRDWVLFDSMHDRIEDGRSSRNVPNVVHLPDFEDWLTNPEKLCKVSDRDAKKTVPDYIRRLTQDVYVCMYYSDMNEMF